MERDKLERDWKGSRDKTDEKRFYSLVVEKIRALSGSCRIKRRGSRKETKTSEGAREGEKQRRTGAVGDELSSSELLSSCCVL